MTPSPYGRVFSRPKAVERCRASSSSSTNDPSSKSCSMRSRAVFLPLACCFSTALSEAACTASSIRRVRSSSLPAVVWISMSAGTSVPWPGTALTLETPSQKGGSSVRVVPVPTPQSPGSSSEPPLELDALVDAAGTGWSVNLLTTADSTNAVAAQDPQPDTLVVADHQTAGRGRLDRSWDTPPGSALTFTAVVDPELADHDWPLLPLAVALAVADGVRSASGLEVAVKWPNDLLLPSGKIAGILLERVSGGGRPLALIGIGVNVALGADELPVETASSLAIGGSSVDRTTVFAEVVA